MRQPKILFHFADDPRLRERLARQLHAMEVLWCAESDDARLNDLLPEVDVWWHVLKPIRAEHLDLAPRLQLIQKLGTGLDTIDLEAARSRGIRVSNMAGMNAQAVAESALALLMTVLRDIVRLHWKTVQGQGWPLDPTLALNVSEIAGSTVGLVGSGDIARRFAVVLRAMGATVLFTSRTGQGDPNWRDLETLLAVSDVVSLHVPLTEQTHHLLDRERIASMKPGAVLINTSRGAVLDEAALAEALVSGHLSGAGLDVFESEPWTSSSPLHEAPNVVMTPHVAWLTGPSLSRCVAFAVDNVQRLVAGQRLASQVV